MLKLNIYLKNYWESQYDEHKFVDYPSHFSEKEPCNIYLVGIRPRIIINPNFIQLDGHDVTLEFGVQKGYEFEKILAKLRLSRIPSGEIKIETKPPYTRFNLIDDHGYLLEEKIHNNEDIKPKSFYALRNSIISEKSKFNDLELLYIGKSLKMDNKVSPLKRLRNHEKIQRILQKCNESFIDKELYIILCSFVSKVDLIASTKTLLEEKNIEKKFSELGSKAAGVKSSNEFITQIAEAALIDYFDTKDFNVDFIGSFGRKSHGYYKKIKDSEVSTIVLEVDLTRLCNVFTKSVLPSARHLVMYYPKDNYRKETGDNILNGFV